MNRCTQLIGLTQDAQDFAIKHNIGIDRYNMTQGMFEEIITGDIFYLPPPYGPNREYKLVEVVQDIIWSSGPMILTCLKEVLVKELGQTIESEPGHELFR